MIHTEEYIEDYNAIQIPEEVYDAICKELHCKTIVFMGIS